MNRTPDLLITNELLYQLSYTGIASHYNWRAALICTGVAGPDYSDARARCDRAEITAERG